MPKGIFKKEIKNKFGKISIQFNQEDNLPVEVMIYQDIGPDPWGESDGFTVQDFVELTKDVPNTRDLDVRINSPGGSVWDGMALKSRFDDWKGRKTASIDGMAASVASWICCSFDEIRAPRHAQMFIHPAWGMCMGNGDDMRKQANELDKTTDQIADIYARTNRKGKSKDEILRMMKDETLMTGEEMLSLGFIDRLTDEVPVSNFTEVQIRNMKSKLAALNKLTNIPSQGQQNNNENKDTMRKKLESLLNKWGVKFNSTDTDDQLLALVKSFKPTNKKQTTELAAFNALFEESAKNEDDEDEMKNEEDEDEAPKNAPKPSAEAPVADAAGGAPGSESAEYKAATANMKKASAQMDKFLRNERRKAIQNRIDTLITEGRIQANSAKGWLEMAEASEDENLVLNKLAELPQILPGTTPMNHIELGESDSISDLDRAVTNLMKPQAYLSRNSRGPENLAERIQLGNNSKTVARLVNRLKKYAGNDAGTKGMQGALPEMVGPLREAWDRQMSGSPRNANTMSAQLLRQVILSEVMRAFRRQFTSLEIFAHNFQSVPLEGTDYIEVPYYPLDTVASTEFKYSDGYVVTPNAQTLYKQIYVGGIGNGVATPGSGRKYKALQFSAYEIRRQPWLDIQKLSVMAGEQLALDVRADIIGANINSANFANAIWTGAANGFDHTVVGNVLQQAAIAAFWPLQGRNVVLAPSYYTNLSIDPGLTPWLNIGTTDLLRKGVIGGLYGFENIIYDAKVPVANYIRGGDGTVTAGSDPNLAGFMAWPSAILIATAPIMPPPGVLKKLVAYEQITDDQTGLAFTYQFWGNESSNVDNEIIECTYGSGLGELAALFRLTSAGN
jgi:ATP-dependent Clp protease, protease subunit